MGAIEEKKTGELSGSGDPSAPPPPQQPPHYYGTFQGVNTNLSNHPPPPPPPHHPPQPPPPHHPAMGYPQPMPPPGVSGQPQYHDGGGYQAVPGYAVAEGRPVDERRLPCCGLGCGWFLRHTMVHCGHNFFVQKKSNGPPRETWIYRLHHC